MPRLMTMALEADEHYRLVVFLWFVGFSIHVDRAYVPGRRGWRLAVSLGDRMIHIDLFARPHEWRKGDPWWATSHSIDLEHVLKGKETCRRLEGRWRRARLPMPEGDYGVEVRRVVQIWTWSRWPWSRVRRCWDFQGTERVYGSDVWGIASGGTLKDACADVARRIAEGRGIHAPKHVPSLEAMRDAVDAADAG